MWGIDEVDGAWVLTRDGVTVGDPHQTYPKALQALADAGAAEAGGWVSPGLAEADAGGLLPEEWTSPAGICFSEPTGDGRNFTTCSWSWRDPTVSLLPLMYQSKTDTGHFGAELAGYIARLELVDGTVRASGRFYDTETGRVARDVLRGGGRFGVSVDPSAEVDVEWECLEEDEEGYCVSEQANFTAYQIAGLTMTPFPAFAAASIELAGAGGAAALAVADEGHAFTDGNGDGYCDACVKENDDGDCTQQCGLTEAAHEAEAPAEAPASLAAAALPAVPPAAWFHRAEPTVGDPLLVDQGGGRVAVPLTIDEAGHVFGHMAVWGQCHVGYPGACVEPPTSAAAYRHFHLGATALDDGTSLPTGCLTVGTDHAPLTSAARAAVDHYAHTGLAWADVRVTDGVFGPWVCGSLRPDVTPELLRVLRGSSLSGDWRKVGAGMELVAVLSVNTPGFPITREALAAAGDLHLASSRPQARIVGGEPEALVAAGSVRRCTECGKRAGARRLRGVPVEPDLAATVRRAVAEALGPLAAEVAKVELRTRHLRAGQAESLRARTIRH